MKVFAIFMLLVGLVSSANAQNVAPYQVDATSMSIVIEDQTPRQYPQVGHQSPVTYEQKLREWAAQRFQLTGNSVNALRITLREGRITERLLPIQKGIRGWFTKEESLAYDGALSLEIAIVDVNGAVLSKAEASATMTKTVIEGATTADREAVWLGIVNATFENVDRELRARLAEFMSRYIR